MKITSEGDDVRIIMDMYIKEHPDEKLFNAHSADTEGNVEYDGCLIIHCISTTILTYQLSGKFLDEERRLSEYPFQGSVGHLEVIVLLSAIHDNYFVLNGLLLHHPQ